MSNINPIELPIATPNDLAVNPVKASDLLDSQIIVNDVSYPLAIRRNGITLHLWYRAEYCRLHDSAIIRELRYTNNDKQIIVRYRLTRFIE